MFCYKCGKQLPDDALFCQYCGTKQQTSSDALIVNPQFISDTRASNREMDREALKIYLGNVLSLECAIIRYNREFPKVVDRFEQVKNSYHYYKKYYIRTYYPNDKSYDFYTQTYRQKEYPRYVHFSYNGEIRIARFNDGPLYNRKNLGETSYYWHSISETRDIPFLQKPSSWDNFSDRSDFISIRRTRKEAAETFAKVYEEFKAEAPAAYRDIVDANDKEREKLQKQLDDMPVELANAEKLLEQAYSINIIPSQYRHQIPVLYYLHDFLSTSRESFTTALLHLDLDEIKSKLDRIISQQESMILQNAAMIAQNDSLMKQNQMHLDQLAQIEQNTSQSAQYAHIAANNAAVCAWFSAANYIEAHR